MKYRNRVDKLIKVEAYTLKMKLISRNKYLTIDEFNRADAKRGRTSEFK